MDTTRALSEYLEGPRPHKLEIGARHNSKPRWLATDLFGGTSTSGAPIFPLDVAKPFEIPSGRFDFIYAEHLIEHLTFEQGLNMLCECRRILNSDGVLRVVTPSLGFLMRILSSDRSALESRYRDWSVKTFVKGAPQVTNAFFLNNFMRAWGHTFLYDHETLLMAMKLAGFDTMSVCEFNQSAHEELRDMENTSRLPIGFLELESMVVEGQKRQ